MISVKNLSASYKNKNILQNISFEFNSGDFICLCGKNGAGKSTLLSILANLQDSTLTVKNQPVLKSADSNILISDLKRKECAKKISFMSQNENSLWDLSVFDIVLSGRYAYTKAGIYSKEDYEITKQTLKELNLEDFKDRKVHSLSGGEFQKVRIARSLCQQSDFLLLDEPFASLDFAIEPQIMELLKKIAVEKNKGIIISIHDLNLAARYGEKILLLKNQTSVFGSVDKIFTEENLSQAFNQPLKVYTHPVFNCKQVY